MITAAGSYTALRDGFTGITGASNLEVDGYRSSTEVDSGFAWDYYFDNGIWNPDSKGLAVINVRACLAF
jgi:hypothetical protein